MRSTWPRSSPGKSPNAKPPERRHGSKPRGFPAHKDLEEFNFDHQPSADRNLIAHLGTGVFLSEAKNVVLLGPHGHR